MQSAGVQVDVAGNGQIALDILNAAPPDTYHLVLMDLQMPRMDGHQATLAIREDGRFKDLPIIAMTAHAMVEERERCIAEGMNDHITKPIDPAVLYRTLLQWGGHAVHDPVANDAAASPPVPVAASQASALAVDDFVSGLQAAVPGLDVAASLRRVANNQKLYQSLLRRYSDEQASAPQRIRDCLVKADRHGAELLAHTLKGVSSNIGAMAVATQASLLEAGLRGEASPVALEAMLLTTEHILAPTVMALHAYLSPAADSAEPTGTAPLKPLSPALRIQLDEICDLLDDMDADAAERLEALHAELATSMQSQTLQAIEASLASFNLDEAARLLREAMAAPSIAA
jgi:CheY-like chemotaxis protein